MSGRLRLYSAGDSRIYHLTRAARDVAAQKAEEASDSAAEAGLAGALAGAAAASPFASNAATAAELAEQRRLEAEAAAQLSIAQAAAAAASVPAAASRAVGERLANSAAWPILCATPREVWTPQGLLTQADINALPWDYDPDTLEARGVAFAPARAPLHPHTRTPGGTGWSRTGILEPTPALGPDGQMSAWRITEDNANSPHFISLGSVPYTQNGRMTVGALVRAGTALTPQFSGGGNLTGQTYRTNFLLTGAGAVTQFSSSSRRSAIRRLGNGFYWIQTTWSMPASGSTAIIYLALTNGDTSHRPTYLGAGRYLDVYAMWAENGPFSTFCWAGPRAQPKVSIPVRVFGGQFSRARGRIIVDWISGEGPFNSTVTGPDDWMGIASWGDGGAANRMGLLINPAGTVIEARVVADGVEGAVSTVNIPAVPAGQTARALLAWDLSQQQMQVSAGGVAGSKVALTAVPAPGVIMPGRYGPSNPLHGWMLGTDVQPAPLFDSAAAALT